MFYFLDRLEISININLIQFIDFHNRCIHIGDNIFYLLPLEFDAFIDFYKFNCTTN